MDIDYTHEQMALINAEFGAIGIVKVLSTGNKESDVVLMAEFGDGRSLDVGDLVAIVTSDGHVLFGFTTEPDIRSDLDPRELIWESPLFAPEAMTARPIIRLWSVKIFKSTAGNSRPPHESLVFYPSAAGVAVALGQDEIPAHQRLATGVLENGDGAAHAIHLNADFVLGPQGVHATWSGISGLSGKTSKKALLTKAMLTQAQALGYGIATVVFATKGSDELFRDLPSDPNDLYWRTHPDQLLQVTAGALLTPEDIRLYETLGLDPAPFDPVTILVPCGNGIWNGYRTPETDPGLGTAQLRDFAWGLPQVAPYLSLFASTDMDDKLRALEAEIRGILRFGYTTVEGERRRVSSFKDLDDFFAYAMAHIEQRSQRWEKHHIATIERAQSRYASIFQRASQVVTAEPEGRDLPYTELRAGDTWVIDLSHLNEDAKQLVLYKVITELHEAMAGRQLRVDRLLIDVDELNQHAPRGRQSPTTRFITTKLQDLAERARTDGLILLTAQQTLSAVDERIEANLSTRFIGLLSEQESRQGVYGLTDTERQIVRRLTPGEMLVEHPCLPQRVKVRVPRAPFLRGKDGQRLLRPPSEQTLNPIERLLAALPRMLAGAFDRRVPDADDLRLVINRTLDRGGSLRDLDQAAREVGQVRPLENGRNTARSTLSLWRKKIADRTGLDVSTAPPSLPEPPEETTPW